MIISYYLIKLNKNTKQHLINHHLTYYFMKNLELNLQQLGNVTVLTRNQLKNTLGGTDYCNFQDIKCPAGTKCVSTHNIKSPDQGKCQ